MAKPLRLMLTWINNSLTLMMLLKLQCYLILMWQRRPTNTSSRAPEELCVRETFNWIKGLYKRWTRRDSRSKEEIGETVILEQFLHMLHPDVCTWVKENNPKTEEEAANLAECYLAPHR